MFMNPALTGKAAVGADLALQVNSKIYAITVVTDGAAVATVEVYHTDTSVGTNVIWRFKCPGADLSRHEVFSVPIGKPDKSLVVKVTGAGSEAWVAYN